MVKNLPAMQQDTGDLGWLLGQEDPVEEGTAPMPILPEKFHGQKSLGSYHLGGCKRGTEHATISG